MTPAMARRLKRYHPPGTSPGTLPETGVQASFQLFTYGVHGLRQASAPSVAEALALPRERGWLRITGLADRAVSELGTRLGVHPLVLEDILNPGQRPKAETHASYLFFVVDIPTLTDSGLEEVQVSLLVFSDLVVSVEEKPNAFFAAVEKRLALGTGRLFQYGSDYLAYALIDTAVDHFFPVLEKLGERLEAMEEVLLQQHDQVLSQLHQLRRDFLRLRRSLWPLREAVATLLREENPVLSPEVRVFLRDVQDHVLYLLDILESYRETAARVV